MSDRQPGRGGYESGDHTIDDLPPIPENLVHRCPADRLCPVEWPAHEPGEYVTVASGERQYLVPKLPSPAACADRAQASLIGLRPEKPCPACHHPAMAHADGAGCGLCRLTAEVRERLPLLVRDEVLRFVAEERHRRYAARRPGV